MIKFDNCNRRCVYDQLNFTLPNEIAQFELGERTSSIKLI